MKNNLQSSLSVQQPAPPAEFFKIYGITLVMAFFLSYSLKNYLGEECVVFGPSKEIIKEQEESHSIPTAHVGKRIPVSWIKTTLASY